MDGEMTVNKNCNTFPGGNTHPNDNAPGDHCLSAKSSLATYNCFRDSDVTPECIWKIIPLTSAHETKGCYGIDNVRKGSESRPEGLRKCFPHCVDVGIKDNGKRKYSLKLSSSVSCDKTQKKLNIHITGCRIREEAESICRWFCNICNFTVSVVSDSSLVEKAERFLEEISSTCETKIESKLPSSNVSTVKARSHPVDSKTKRYFEFMIREFKDKFLDKIKEIASEPGKGRISSKNMFITTFTVNYNVNIGPKTRSDLIIMRDYFLSMDYRASYDPLIDQPLVLINDIETKNSLVRFYMKGSAYMCLGFEEAYIEMYHLIVSAIEYLHAKKKNKNEGLVWW